MMLTRRAGQLLQLFLIYGLSLCSEIFPNDILTPYTDSHGSKRFSRDVSNCKHVSWENETFEVFKLNVEQPQPSAQIQVHRFADSVSDQTLPGNLTRHLRHVALGTIAFINDPYYQLSVLEPGGEGGCKKTFLTAKRSLVRETASVRPAGCEVAVNAGYFKVSSGECYGNIVTDGQVVQTSNDEQNANFGIRQDGTIVVGYIPDSEITNTTNPFRQLVTGVIWLVRNGTNFVEESIKLECSLHEDTGKIETFAKVFSARTAVGHDSKGRVVIVQVDGQTHRRGVNLWQFADILISHGIVNAINLDGGGSSTFIYKGSLINYPSDHCWAEPKYRCERKVSTVLCAHTTQCLEPLCNKHGSCDNGHCSCDTPWIGEACDRLNCSQTNCSSHGNCSEGVCSCEAGWMGSECNETCPWNKFGPGCTASCWCYGRSYCDRMSGKCLCPPGYTGYGCWRECPANTYGQDCLHNCSYPDCSGHGKCSPINGSCLCETAWSGPACNISLEDTLDSLLPEKTTPTLVTPVQILATPTSPMNVSQTAVSVSSTRHQASSSQLSSSVTPSQTPGKSLLGNSPTVVDKTRPPITTEGESPQSSFNPPLRNTAPHWNSPEILPGHSDSGKDTPTQPPTECAAPPTRMRVGVMVGVGLATVCLHVILCLWTRKTLYKSLLSWYDDNIRSKLSRTAQKRRRRRRRKQYFVPLSRDSSSDCSI